MNRQFLLSLLVTLLGLPPLRAELRWDSRKVELAPSPLDTVADATFGFVNAGSESVKIESVKSSCGCTIPKMEKMTYAPGERGEVHARFEIGDRRGTHEVAVRVAITGEHEPAALALVVKIPEAARITPTILVWERGEQNTPKVIVVESLPNQPLRVVQVTPSAPGFATQVETIREAAEYRVTVTPKSTERPTVVVLGIEMLLMEKKKVLQAYAQVRPQM